jgi:uncharacterized protein (TIGR02172 family)
MENVLFRIESGNLIIGLKGHIDSSNAPAVEAEINKIRSENKGGSFTLDAQELEYISSAGLRIILRLSKTEPTLKLINVSSAVYEVLEMTGFSEMIPVSKAFRILSVEGCETIGQGANGKVYRLDPDTIIKVYFNADALPEINRERELARKAFVLGIPTAIPYDVVKVGDKYGSVFELLNAKSLSKLIAENPSRIDEYVRMYVDLLKKIHSTKVEPGDMPNIKESGLKWADYLKDYLKPEENAKLVKLISGIPDVHYMIHGDYHTKNIMLQNKEVLLIDMDTLSYGHPIFEISSMFLAFIGFAELDHDVDLSFLGLSYEVCEEFFHKAMMMYLGTTDEKRYREVVDKASVIGYTRLMRRTLKRVGAGTEKGQPIIDNCHKHLSELLPRIDTLTF